MIFPSGPIGNETYRFPPFHSFTLEYTIHMSVTKWGKGKHLYIAFRDGEVVAQRGVESSYPSDQGVRIIR